MSDMPLPDAAALIAKLRNKLAAWPGIVDFHFIGIERGGMLLARWLHEELHIKGRLGSLNISFHRDDFSSMGLAGHKVKNPLLGPSHIPFSLTGADVMLIDDVFMTGRSTRAALNELFDFGRPKCVRFACLIDLGVSELPIQPDLAATSLTLEASERIQLSRDEAGDFRLQLRSLTVTTRN